VFGLSSLIAYTLPGICVPALMGVFGTNTRTSWTYNFVTNTSICIAGNLAYAIFINTEQAEWDPASPGVIIEAPKQEEFIMVVGEKPYGETLFDNEFANDSSDDSNFDDRDPSVSSSSTIISLSEPSEGSLRSRQSTKQPV